MAADRFRKALRQHPGAPAAVRVAIAAAAFRLGKLEVARKAFKRALALDPACVPALTGLAVLAQHGPPSRQVYLPDECADHIAQFTEDALRIPSCGSLQGYAG